SDRGQAATLMSDCHFSFNISGSGGIGSTAGYYLQPIPAGSGGAGGGGGAVWAEGSVRMNDCTFVSNQAGLGGPGGRGSHAGGAGGIGGAGGAICALRELSLA